MKSMIPMLQPIWINELNNTEQNLHPLDDAESYENYKLKKNRYSRIFSYFLNGKIDKQEMIKQMDEAENKDIPDFQPFEEINIVDLETKEEKTVRLVTVD
jgi:hypothetical protein